MLKDAEDNRTFFTNEESRVSVYSSNQNPTNPSSVTNLTELNELNLNWREKDLPERERTKHVHRLHPYLGKYIPQLVEIFLRKYFNPGQTVFDPFSGSGTTLVQAKELGIHSVGCDISEFNVILARAKTKSYSISKVKLEIQEILHRVNKEAENYSLHQETTLSVKQSHLVSETQSEYLNKWFAPQALKELVTFRNMICDYEDQDILKVILSRAARSARLTAHFDLDFPKNPQVGPYYCYKHRRTCQPTSTAIQFLRRYGLDTIKRIEEFSLLASGASANVLHDDSRCVNPGNINGVITSPPYVGLIDYHEQHRYAYELFGINDQSDLEIGPASKGAGKKAKALYKDLITEVFLNAMQYMPSGSPIVVVAGDRHNLYTEIAEACNVAVEDVIQRHVNRRTGMRAGEFYESVFIWRKK